MPGYLDPVAEADTVPPVTGGEAGPLVSTAQRIDAQDGCRSDAHGNPEPPTIADIPSELWAPEDDPHRYFSDEERRAAAWLESHGVRLRSIRPRNLPGQRTPDSMLVNRSTTVEIKGVDEASSTAVLARIRDGRRQSRRLVIDGRDVGLTPSDAERGIRRALGVYGGQLDEVLILLADHAGVPWWHG